MKGLGVALTFLLASVYAQDPIVRIIETEPLPSSLDNVIRAKRGHDVTMSCRVENLPKFATVRWQKLAIGHKPGEKTPSPVPISTNQAVEDNIKFSIEKPTQYTWRLRIRSPTVPDSANYTCFVQTTIQARVNVTMMVQVMIPPYLKEVSPDTTVKETDRVRLVCDAEGLPKPKVWWQRLGNQRLPTNREKQEGAELQWENASPADAGTYRCRYENIIGSYTWDVELKVRYRPIISFGIASSVIYQAPGYQIELQCLVDSNPFPTTMVWIKGALTITQSTNRYKVRSIRGAFNKLTYELIFNWVVEGDYGDYKCQFKNQQGTSARTITLKRSDTPQPSIKFGEIRTGSAVSRSVSVMLLLAALTVRHLA